MARIVFCGAMSHSPLMNFPSEKDREPIARFRAAVAVMAEQLHAARPDVVIIFGPDHFRTLFCDLMPAFALGTDHIEGWGDWNTPAGPFETNRELAEHILAAVFSEGFDAAFSREIKIDHGITQPVQLLELSDIPIIPIIINCAAPPFPFPSRCHHFGRAVGRAIRSFTSDLSVALVGSGGLSHDPPAPSAENAVHGRTNGFASSRDREAKLMSRIDSLQRRINSEWDRNVLDHFLSGRVDTLAAKLTTTEIDESAGSGAQEIRTWIAIAGASGDSPMRILFYEPIDALITGMGIVVA